MLFQCLRDKKKKRKKGAQKKGGENSPMICACCTFSIRKFGLPFKKFRFPEKIFVRKRNRKRNQWVLPIMPNRPVRDHWEYPSDIFRLNRANLKE